MAPNVAEQVGPGSTGKDTYGYAQDGVTIIEREAAIVREIFAQYLEGVPPRQIALDLGTRGELICQPAIPSITRSVIVEMVCFDTWAP